MTAKAQDLLRSHWDDVRVFLAVHREGSLGKAAHRLGIDTSTVSRRLSALEDALGARLFERRRDGIHPSELAIAVAPAAEAMEAALALFARTASGAEAGPEGVVRLSGPAGLVEALVAPRLGALRAAHPRVRLEIDTSSKVLDLGRREADLALRSVRPEGAGIVATKLGGSHWRCVGARALVARAGRLERWSAVPWIGWDHELGSFGPSRWLATHSPDADVALRTSHVGVQLAACRAGVGAMLHIGPPVTGLAAFALSPRLAATTKDLPYDELWLVSAAAARNLPRVAAVWDFLVKELREGLAPSKAPPRRGAGAR